MTTMRSKTRLLIAVNVALGLAVASWGIIELRPDPDPAPDTESPQLRRPYAISRGIPTTKAAEEHPLFTRTRAAAPEAPAVESAVPPQPPPILVGILRDSEGHAGVVLEDPLAGTRKYVRQGGAFQDWMVTAVRPKQAVISRGSTEVELGLSFELRTPEANPDSASNPPRNP